MILLHNSQVAVVQLKVLEINTKNRLDCNLVVQNKLTKCGTLWKSVELANCGSPLNTKKVNRLGHKYKCYTPLLKLQMLAEAEEHPTARMLALSGTLSNFKHQINYLPLVTSK